MASVEQVIKELAQHITEHQYDEDRLEVRVDDEGWLGVCNDDGSGWEKIWIYVGEDGD